MDGIIRIERNRMSGSDVLATVGVSILLAAFILNTRNLLAADKKWYNILSVTGATLCGYSAFLISFYPFVVLETVWALVAAFALIEVFHVKHRPLIECTIKLFHVEHQRYV